jgi:hypothetical protein
MNDSISYFSTFIQIAEASNSWIITHSLTKDNDYSAQEFNEMLKKFGGKKSSQIFIQFQNYDSRKLEHAIKELENSLTKFEISDGLYNISRSLLSSILSEFIKNYSALGIVSIPLTRSLIKAAITKKTISTIKANIAYRDKEILLRYKPEILKLREIYSDSLKFNNIKRIVDQIYLSPTHDFSTSFFDSEGKKLKALYHEWYEWYAFSTNNTKLMLAIGAFGYEDNAAIYFLAFHRLISHLDKVVGRQDWRIIDNLIPQLIKGNLGLLELISWLIEDNIISASSLLEAAPIASLIPGDNLLLANKSFDDEGFKLHVKNFYPNLEYNLLE